MDILKFINSRDIREHLKNINYQFTSLETAWLIWQNRLSSLKEKHEALNELIVTMADCKIERRPNTNPHHSLHAFLEELMALENRCVESVKVEEPYSVYAYRIFLPEDNEWNDRSEYLYPNFSACFDSALDECKVYSKDISGCRIRIQKSWFDGTGNCIEIEVTINGEIIKILNHGNLTNEEMNLVVFGLDGLWFDFPTPFKKGDIICDPERQDKFGLERGPCVIEHKVPWESSVERLKKDGDSSDMLVYGIFQMENGTVYNECTASYMNFEYYRPPLVGRRRILGAISNYLKGEISLDLLLNAYHTILAEEQTKDTRPWNITKEGLELAGIPQKEK